MYLIILPGTAQININENSRKIERMDLTMARRRKRNYEGYIN